MLEFCVILLFEETTEPLMFRQATREMTLVLLHIGLGWSLSFDVALNFGTEPR